MFYEFPVIRNIHDVLPHIEDRPEFIVAKRQDITIVNYLVHTPGLFGDASKGLSYGDTIRRECRGLIFDSNDGFLLSRPYHKFFNVGEQIETQPDLVNSALQDRSFKFLEKLDGSMVRPVIVGNKLRFATKMGFTDVAVQVDAYLDSMGAIGTAIRDFCYDCVIDGDMTPIFEWCSRNQRIVVDYPEDMLVLTAVRDNIEGVYIEPAVVIDYYKSSSRDTSVIRLVTSLFSEDASFSEVQTALNANDTSEGIVVRFDNGHMLKMKTDWYCQLHRSKDIASRTHDVVQCILSDVVDDLKSNLVGTDRERVDNLERRINSHVVELVFSVNKFIADNRRIYGASKKDFALRLQNHTGFSSDFNSVLFSVWDGKSALDMVRRYVINRTNTMSSCAKYMEENKI
jgi:RNA ligase